MTTGTNSGDHDYAIFAIGFNIDARYRDGSGAAGQCACGEPGCSGASGLGGGVIGRERTTGTGEDISDSGATVGAHCLAQHDTASPGRAASRRLSDESVHWSLQ